MIRNSFNSGWTVGPNKGFFNMAQYVSFTMSSPDWLDMKTLS
jgi:hypothetical protein